ncbi:MAG: hypothetical protein CVV27_13630 [Candidatus Melainabacteria bacterium HGW-Melainabacteria-1]|nr:MAG: hypothetical protein CVV27_13630 [Candidatus Melainabacteria bacterium HGW-Melainabacteria-1]
MSTALIWEPDPLQAAYLVHIFTEAGFTARGFSRYRSFQQALAAYPQAPLLALYALDQELDKGLARCARLRQRYPLLCLILLSRHQDQAHCLAAFAAGADDFLVKPFAPAELLARARAHLQRSAEILAAWRIPAAETLNFGGMSLDLARQEALFQGRRLSLKGHEFELLHCLCQHAGQYLSREQIARRIWDKPLAPGSRKVDNLILRLRKALPPMLQINSAYGKGYQLLNSDNQDNI